MSVFFFGGKHDESGVEYIVRVVAMPYDGPLGEYLGGTPDGKTPGTFYANVTHPEKRWAGWTCGVVGEV